ncbi:MAG: hypothetical protein NTY35_13480 [Planctomycetota bacterium]|nr:hypothetical protein [Planctomycetota bacterium]
MPKPRSLLRLCASSVAVVGLALASGSSMRAEDARTEKSVNSNGGRYVLHVKEPEGGFVRGKPLSLEVRVTRAGDPSATVPGLGLVVDADMPEHLHGTNRVPRIQRRADGSFLVENLYLHMPGWWELFLDVVESPWTERAQMRVEIE